EKQDKKPDPVTKKPQGDEIVYSDELLYHGGMYRRIKTYKDSINQLIELQELAKQKDSLLTLNIYYVTGPEGVAEFAKHAVANGAPGSINYFYGHGTAQAGGEVSKD